MGFNCPTLADYLALEKMMVCSSTTIPEGDGFIELLDYKLSSWLDVRTILTLLVDGQQKVIINDIDNSSIWKTSKPTWDIKTISVSSFEVTLLVSRTLTIREVEKWVTIISGLGLLPSNTIIFFEHGDLVVWLGEED